MTLRAPAQPLSRLLAAFATTLVMLLPLSAPTMAQAPRSGCSPGSAQQAKPGRVCAHYGRKHRAHARSKVKVRHAGSAGGRKSSTGSTNTAAHPRVSMPTAQPCADASVPTASGEDYLCQNGSEPTCSGANATFSSDGSTITCGDSAGLPASGEPACEDSGAPEGAGEDFSPCTASSRGAGPSDGGSAASGSSSSCEYALAGPFNPGEAHTQLCAVP